MIFIPGFQKRPKHIPNLGNHKQPNCSLVPVLKNHDIKAGTISQIIDYQKINIKTILYQIIMSL